MGRFYSHVQVSTPSPYSYRSACIECGWGQRSMRHFCGSMVYQLFTICNKKIFYAHNTVLKLDDSFSYIYLLHSLLFLVKIPCIVFCIVFPKYHVCNSFPTELRQDNYLTRGKITLKYRENAV